MVLTKYQSSTSIRKEDLVRQIDCHLKENEASLIDRPEFGGYYGSKHPIRVTSNHSLRDGVRRTASSVATIRHITLLIEAAGLVWNLPWTMPPRPVSASLSQHALRHYSASPDNWSFLINNCCYPSILWILTSCMLPLILAYVFNMTPCATTGTSPGKNQYLVDPLTFNVVKAVLAYYTYGRSVMGNSTIDQGHTWYLFSQENIGIVRNSVTGGYNGLQIGAAVGIIFCLNESALRC